MSETCNHSDLYVGLKRQPCYCSRPGCTRTDTGTSNDICPHWQEDRIVQLKKELAMLEKLNSEVNNRKIERRKVLDLIELAIKNWSTGPTAELTLNKLAELIRAMP